MTATMLTKGLNKLSLNGSDKSPSDRDFIDHLNYEELERKFCVYKYYPQYIHNVEAPTPMIKDMISDKPIYAQANRHVKKKQHQEHKQERREEKRALREEKKEERKQNREEKRDLRLQQRQERRELRQDQHVRSKQQQAYPRHITNANSNANANAANSNGDNFNFNGTNANASVSSSNVVSNSSATVSTRAKDVHIHNHINVNVMAPKIEEADELTFRNPFGPKPPTFEDSQLLAKESSGTNRSLVISTRMRRSSTQSSNKRHNSIASKFVNILMGNLSSGEETPGSNDDNELHVSSSYDATKSNMTSSRSKKTNLLKLKLDPRRRMSEQIGKLLFHFFWFLDNPSLTIGPSPRQTPGIPLHTACAGHSCPNQ